MTDVTNAGITGSARSASAGTSTIEALVALALLAIMATSLVHTLATSTGARASSASWLRASEVALAVIEQIRVEATAIPTQAQGFEHTWSVHPLGDYPELLRYQVVVRWTDRKKRSLTLEGLIWSGS